MSRLGQAIREELLLFGLAYSSDFPLQSALKELLRDVLAATPEEMTAVMEAEHERQNPPRLEPEPDRA